MSYPRIFLFFVVAAGLASAQPVPPALKLARAGRCAEALPLLKSGAGAAGAAQRREFQIAGVRCAMALNRAVVALGFAQVLQRDFASDPEILYLLTHLYSDLSMRTSQELLSRAPGSYQVHQLNAEALEAQGRWEDAEKEYRSILESQPGLAGVHFRLGRLQLSRQPATADAVERARQEFEAELKVNPDHAGAEFVLGEMSWREEKYDDAIAHFSRAVELDSGNADAHLGLGRSYLKAGKYKEAIPPLETAARLERANPEPHFHLAVAYAREGRKEDAAREAALHKEMLARAQERRDALMKGVQGNSSGPR